jgi:hypothetical protein
MDSVGPEVRHMIVFYSPFLMTSPKQCIFFIFMVSLTVSGMWEGHVGRIEGLH